MLCTFFGFRCGTCNEPIEKKNQRKIMFENLVKWKYYVKIQHEKPLKWPITKEKPQKIIFRKQHTHTQTHTQQEDDEKKSYT